MKAARPGGPCPPCPPCPGPAAPARPQPQPGQGSLAWRGAQWARLTHQSKLSRPEGEAPRTPAGYLCSSILPGTCPRPLDRPPQTTAHQGEESNSRARTGRREREAEEEKGRGVVSQLAASSRLLLPKPASEVTAVAVTSAEPLTSRPLLDLTSAGWRWRSGREEGGMDGGGRRAPIPPEISC